MAFRHGFKAEANRIALKVRDKMGLGPIDRIDPIAICAEFDIVLLKLSELDCDAKAFLGRDQSAFSAVTVPRGATTAIVHNDSHHPHRQRSNICHELAHCFLGHKCTPPLTAKGERSRDGGIEAEANFLGGCLLISNEAALNIVSQGLVSVAKQLYGVSQPMLDYRLRVSGAHTIHARRVGAGSRNRAGAIS
ncbi:ImmA/IrrE family metallo-endopeptidase [Mesorhizobium sp. M7A.F.Ca.US.006.04.2.1]|uniref:ImmA/IrrE family metallo-endopeptidase n=1 Tax=unclassified Mesorhizobium TaxID=325217 RepID=UPI000FCA2EFA|nr:MULTISPECIES: ImmA/IrrE family metallo-endopeptidase [unclassified Mesorhizobium]RUX73381.1 ImmA/IrrE family metallo-endopeptidase [Mesorhizobium sp. M7A.F.Ca.US.005.03.1.1]RUY19360.1 ImmA/IrrE family metallo-endopeptidase [Mesorhizobium sp. M7A.F.Ca.US.005.03.2.1]RVA96647.1 ImmA/IrrE family metallo-endopeptidase [Mesorhizobium sp. M7A.F.Ca.US.006.04.2.1]